MDGKSLPHFPDEFRVRIGGNYVGAGTGFAVSNFERGPWREPSPAVASDRTVWRQCLSK